MKTDYLEGIATVKHFLDDIGLISQKKYSAIDLDFYKNNFEKLLFYISKSFLSDNFDELFYNLDDESINTVFNEGIRLNKFLDKHSDLAIYLSTHQCCKLPKRLHDDPMLGYRVVIRNALCHYRYKLNKDRVIFEKVEFNEGAEISVASLAVLLCGTLASYGQSRKKGAYDYWPLLDRYGNGSFLIMIKNIDDNTIAPADLIVWSQQILGKRQTIDASLSRKFIDYVKGYAPNFGRYYIKKINFDQTIMKKAKINRVSNIEELNLYMCAHDDIKRAGIAYSTLTRVLFALSNNDIDSIEDEIGSLGPILSNTVFISYMSLVFDDLFARDFNGTIKSGLFIEKPKVEDKSIPWKFRNSLAHSRYRFENIFDSSGKIVIEFWDEDKNGINFECKITKENATTLIEDYLAQTQMTLSQ